MITLGIAKARAEFGDLCRRVSGQRERVTITDHGTAVAVLISRAELADLEGRAAKADRQYPRARVGRSGQPPPFPVVDGHGAEACR